MGFLHHRLSHCLREINENQEGREVKHDAAHIWHLDSYMRWVFTRSEGDTVLACSALKRAYRMILIFGSSPPSTRALGPKPIVTNNSQLPACDWPSGPEEGDRPTINWPRFFHLRGAKGTIADRIKRRSGHYMPSTLIDSQFEALDEVSDEERLAMKPATISVIDVSKSLDKVIDEIGELLGRG